MTFTTTQLARAKELRSRGWYWREIGRALNVSPSTVRYWVSEKNRADCLKNARKQYARRVALTGSADKG